WSMGDRGNLRPLATFDLGGCDDRLGAAFDAELLEDGGYVRLDGRLRYVELVGDLLVEQPFRQHHEHTHLLGRQRSEARQHRGTMIVGFYGEVEIGRRPDAAVEHLLDRLPDHLDAEGLGNEARRAEIHAAADHGGIVITRYDHHGDARVLRP